MEYVVIEAVLVVPEAERVHRVRDVDEVLPKLASDIFVSIVLARQFQRNAEHVQAVHRHPAGTVGLLEVSARGQRCAPVKDANVVQAEEAALEDVSALRVLAIDPPREVEDQLLEDPGEKLSVSSAAALLVDLVDAPCG